MKINNVICCLILIVLMGCSDTIILTSSNNLDDNVKYRTLKESIISQKNLKLTVDKDLFEEEIQITKLKSYIAQYKQERELLIRQRDVLKRQKTLDSLGVSTNIENDTKDESNEIEGIYVQVGAFGDKRNAQSYCELLNEKGFSSIIKEESLFLVLTGTFKTAKEAVKTKNMLSKLGFKSCYIRKF